MWFLSSLSDLMLSISCCREERVRRAKQRKREWMLKLYKEGLNGGVTENGLMKEFEDKDGDYELAGDEDAEDLLQWTQRLDFESYVSDWTSIACTRKSSSSNPLIQSSKAGSPFRCSFIDADVLCF